MVQRVRNLDIRWECYWSYFADEKTGSKGWNDQKQTIRLHSIPWEPGIQGNTVVGISNGWEEMKGYESQGEATVAVSDEVGGTSVLLVLLMVGSAETGRVTERGTSLSSCPTL